MNRPLLETCFRPQPHGTTLSVATPPGPAPLHDAEALTGGGRLAHIRLSDQVYALRITRQGKLILTK